MKTINIDGLPGLTMQGSKGSLGERGGSMFYNAGSNFAFSSNFLKAMAISEDDIDNEKFSNEDIKCIPCNGVYPIINDYFFTVENNYTSLYVIKDIIYFSITSYDKSGVNLHEEQLEGFDASTYSTLIKSSGENKSILETLIGRYLQIYNSSKNLQFISQADMTMFSKYPVYIIKYLDTWEYLDANPSDVDIAVTTITSLISLPSWNGKYEIKKQKCSGHRFDIVNIATDGEYLGSVYDKHVNDVQSQGFTFRILDASTYLPIVDNRSASYAIYKDADRMTWTSGLQAFEQIGTHIISQESEFIENGTAHTIELPQGDHERIYMKLDVEGYFTTRVFLTGATDYTIYMFKYILSDEVLNADFQVVHEYEYFDTSSPAKNEEGELSDFVTTKFYVTSSMSKEEKAKYRLEAEFTSTGFKKPMMSTMRPKLWIGSSEEELNPQDLIYERKYGKADNFNHRMNFDREDPGDFTVVIKDYNEGNDVRVFSSSVIIPQHFEEDYTMTIYGYYKASSDHCVKLYFGKGMFGDTIV